jgi:hypothetical protein
MVSTKLNLPGMMPVVDSMMRKRRYWARAGGDIETPFSGHDLMV